MRRVGIDVLDAYSNRNGGGLVARLCYARSQRDDVAHPFLDRAELLSVGQVKILDPPFGEINQDAQIRSTESL